MQIADADSAILNLQFIICILQFPTYFAATQLDAAMDVNELPPVSDSPWFWVLVFVLVGLVGLAAIHDKYGKRQAGIERQYQARERTAEQVAAVGNAESGDGNTVEDVPLPAYATPGHNLISIWPLFAILALLGVVAAIMLSRERKRIGTGPGTGGGDAPAR